MMHTLESWGPDNLSLSGPVKPMSAFHPLQTWANC